MQPNPGFSATTVLSLILVAFAGAAVHAQAPRLVRDIDTVPAPNPSSWPQGFAQLGSTCLFAARTSAFGLELWKTAGNPGSTQLVVDLAPGAASSSPSNLIALGTRVLFTATVGGVFGLYSSDGSAAGTSLIRAFPSGAEFARPARVGSFVYFALNDQAQGLEPWVTDGSTAGTRLLADLAPGGESSNPAGFLDLNGRCVFGTANWQGGALWETDGTTPGTRVISSFAVQALPGVVLGSTLFFRAGDAAGNGLWISDGTAAGTRELLDANAGRISDPENFVAVGSRIVFSAVVGSAGREPWVTDGTSAGTVLLADVYPGGTDSGATWFRAAAGHLVFYADDGTHGSEPWVTDGTTAGTLMLADVWPGSGGWLPEPDLGAVTAVIGAETVFVARSPGSGIEPWISDGTPAGTRLLRDIAPGTGDSAPRHLHTASAGSIALFSADDGSRGWELWSTDGTGSGTVLVEDIDSVPVGATQGADPALLIDRAGSLFFYAADAPGFGPGFPGNNEPWTSDGSSAGTLRLADVWPGSSGSRPVGRALLLLGPSVLFGANDGIGFTAWISDGSSAGTRLLAVSRPQWGGRVQDAAVSLGQRAIFNAQGSLKATDGTAAGTVTLASLVDASNLRKALGRVWFQASSTSGNLELWTSDGTAAGTALLRDIRPGTGSSSPADFVEVGGRVLFAANDGSTGRELWVSDGTAAGTTRLADLRSGSTSSNPASLTRALGRVFFQANGGALGAEPWISDGTPGGTSQLLDVAAGTTGSDPASFIELGDRVVFVATDLAHGRELWVTDGTSAGTVLLADIAPGTASSSPADLFASGSRFAWFSADDAAHGRELWVTDGTPAGTRLVADHYPGGQGSSPSDFELSRGKLYFAATDAVVGRELFVLDDPGASSRTVGGSSGTLTTRLTTSDPVIGGTFALRLTDAAPSASVFVVLSAVSEPQPLGSSAWLYVDGASLSILAFGASDAHGAWSTTFALPHVLASLHGLTIALQAIVGPTAAPFGSDLSNGVHATFGY